MINRVIPAIAVQIKCLGIRILNIIIRIPRQEPPQLWAVVPALEVVQPGLAVKVVAGVSEGLGQGSRLGGLVAPGIVLVPGENVVVLVRY